MPNNTPSESVAFNNPFRFFIKTLTGMSSTLEARPNSTIEEIKQAIQKRYGYPLTSIRLIFAGEQLENEKTIQDYNIDSRCTVHIIQKLHGD